MQQTQAGGVRDLGVRKLRDMTVAVAVAAAAGVGVIGWISAVTVPGSNGISSLIGNAITQSGDQTFSTNDDGFGFAQAPPSTAQVGPAVAVSGGSKPRP